MEVTEVVAAFFARDTGVTVVEIAQAGFARRALWVESLRAQPGDANASAPIACQPIYPEQASPTPPGQSERAAMGYDRNRTMKKPPINPTNYDAIPTYVNDGDGLVHAIIETPAQIRHKYAFVPKYGIMQLKLTLAEGLAWPYDYGFIPQTRADDGDPTDVLVLGDAPTFSGCLLQVRVLGAVLLKKDGVVNNRLVACPKKTHGVALSADAFKDIGDIPKETLKGIERFLIEYSGVEGNTIEFDGTCSRKKALAMIDRDRKQFKKQSKT
jgi:inorganic pyrophosphatase